MAPSSPGPPSATLSVDRHYWRTPTMGGRRNIQSAPGGGVVHQREGRWRETSDFSMSGKAKRERGSSKKHKEPLHLIFTKIHNNRFNNQPTTVSKIQTLLIYLVIVCSIESGSINETRLLIIQVLYIIQKDFKE